MALGSQTDVLGFPAIGGDAGLIHRATISVDGIPRIVLKYGGCSPGSRVAHHAITINMSTLGMKIPPEQKHIPGVAQLQGHHHERHLGGNYS